MIRWLLVVFLALVLLGGLHPWLQRLGLGRLPGDWRFTVWGRAFFVPFTSTVLLSVLAAAVARWL